jgi:flavin reductase (DIM6/NTAB) family NADH-FMN oxidoreductase RutF
MTKRILKPSIALYPVPVVLVSCGPAEKPNVITIAWTGVICSTPPMVSISIRPSRYSHELIKESREFVVNVPAVSQLEKVDYCGIVSGRQVNKFEVCDFTAAPASQIKTPIIAECPVNMECTVTEIVSLGSHDLFIAKIEAVQGDETVMDSKGVIDATEADPINYMAQRYYQLGSYLDSHGFSKGQLS